MARSFAPTVGAALLVGAGWLAAPSLASATSSADALATEAGPSDSFHRGHGWYDAKVRVPEPPLALALVILGAAAMRLRDRRLRRA